MPLTYRPYAESWNPKKRMATQNPYDYGQEALYPDGYQGTPNPVDMSTFFTGGGGAQYEQPAGGGGGPVGGGGGGGGNPYAELISRMLNQQRADIGAEGLADKASRDAAIRRVLISYGEAPDLEGFGGEAKGVLGGLLDEKTKGLIGQNTAEGTSIKARLNQANELAQQMIPANQGGRGTFRTGETGWALGQQAMQDKQKRFDVLQQAIGEVEGAVGGYAANERARQRQLADYENQAAMNAAMYAGDTAMYGSNDPSGYGSMYPEGGPQPGEPYGGVTDPYWQNLINYYEGAGAANQKADAAAKARARAAAAARARAENERRRARAGRAT